MDTAMQSVIHDKLASALIRYDRKQSAKPGHNPYALSHYLTALEKIDNDLLRGMTVREAIIARVCGALINVLLRAVEEPCVTKEERQQADRGYFRSIGL